VYICGSYRKIKTGITFLDQSVYDLTLTVRIDLGLWIRSPYE